LPGRRPRRGAGAGIIGGFLYDQPKKGNID
jgi:hypothetical protein